MLRTARIAHAAANKPHVRHTFCARCRPYTTVIQGCELIRNHGWACERSFVEQSSTSRNSARRVFSTNPSQLHPVLAKGKETKKRSPKETTHKEEQVISEPTRRRATRLKKAVSEEGERTSEPAGRARQSIKKELSTKEVRKPKSRKSAVSITESLNVEDDYGKRYKSLRSPSSLKISSSLLEDPWEDVTAYFKKAAKHLGDHRRINIISQSLCSK